MNQIRRFPLLLCVLLLIISGCAGGTSGSLRSARQSCTMLGGQGSCEGSIGRLNGTYGIDIEDEGILPGDLASVEMIVSVESGPISVFLQGPDGQQTQMDVAPGEFASIMGVAEGDFDGFEVRFQA